MILILEGIFIGINSKILSNLYQERAKQILKEDTILVKLVAEGNPRRKYQELFSNNALRFTLVDLTGKVAVVTGASSGLGQQFARALSEQGCDVAILARRKERLEEFSKVLKMRLKLSSIILEKLIFLSIMQVLLNTQVVFMIIQQPNGIKF